MSAPTEAEWLEFIQCQNRDYRIVLETLYEMSPWIPRDTFKEAFTENDLGDLHDDMFGADA